MRYGWHCWVCLAWKRFWGHMTVIYTYLNGCHGKSKKKYYSESFQKIGKEIIDSNYKEIDFG